MTKWLFIGILALPAVEIAVFILIAAGIGFLPALSLLLAGSLVGSVVLRQAGRARLERLRGAVSQSGLAGLEAGGDAFLTVSAGILLLLPGFITGVLGLLLLLGPVRQWIQGRFQHFVRQTQGGRPEGVVDLGPNEWRQVPEPRLDRPRRKDDPA
jgi:UPF0716 protein FxsA